MTKKGPVLRPSKPFRSLALDVELGGDAEPEPRGEGRDGRLL